MLAHAPLRVAVGRLKSQDHAFYCILERAFATDGRNPDPDRGRLHVGSIVVVVGTGSWWAFC